MSTEKPPHNPASSRNIPPVTHPGAPVPPVTRGLNPYLLDQNMAHFLRRVAPSLLQREQERLEALGAFAGGRLDAQAEMSDKYFPARWEAVFDQPVTPQGRAGRVVLNPEYEACQQEVYKRGFIAASFDKAGPEASLLPYIFQYYLSYADISTGCPPAMTHPIALLLAGAAPHLRDRYLPEMLRTDGLTPIGGTWATEIHSGSDVAQSVTRAEKQKDGTVKLFGHNWFASAIGFSRFLTIKTARPTGAPEGGAGLGLYLVPSHLDADWRVPNDIQITHLKEKMGTKGLPTGEVTLDGTVAYELAPPGQGLRMMMQALGCSRVHNAMAASGVMYRCYREALAWTHHRVTFGKKLCERPMIQDDILNIATSWMAGSALAFEAARAFTAAQENPADKKIESWSRVVTALAKYRTAEDAVRCAKMAVELVGGNGYVRDHPVERIYRDAMVLTVWEGPRHIQALELVRMLGKGGGGAAYLEEMQKRMTAWPRELHDLRHKMAILKAHLIVDLGRLRKNPEYGEEAANRLLDRMADMAAVILLGDEAAWELAHEKDATKIAVVKHLYETLFVKEAALRLDAPPLRQHFAAITCGQVTPPASSSKKGPPAPPPGSTP